VSAGMLLPSLAVAAWSSTPEPLTSGCAGNECSCRTGTCGPFTVNVTSTGEPMLFCLRSTPLAPLSLLGSGARLFAFDEVEITYAGPVTTTAASDDSSFSDLFHSEGADVRALAEAKDAAPPWLSSEFLSSGSPVAGSRKFVFSPHYDSCLAVRSASRYRPVEVTVRFKRRTLGDRDEAYQAGGFESRLAALAAGALLLLAAGYLARSTAFHYGAGISASMLLGVAIVAVLVIEKTTGGRRGTVVSLATVLGWGGALLRWGSAYVEALWGSYWQYVLVYLAVFGVAGYFATFYALQVLQMTDSITWCNGIYN